AREFRPAAVVGRLDDPPPQARNLRLSRLGRAHERADERELTAERPVRRAVRLDPYRGGCDLRAEGCEHGGDACLDQRVDSFRANAQLDTGCTPEIDLALG